MSIERRREVNSNSGWIFSVKDIEDSPSKASGIDKENEQKLRREGCNIIWNVGVILKLKENQTLYTACTFFHRFYMVQSFAEHPLEITALGCLFLAGKVEETPKKCRDIVNVAKEWKEFNYNSANLLQDVLQFEKKLLSTLRFDLYLENPYSYLVKYAKIFDLNPDQKREIVQFAWTFLNDCAGTTLSIMYEPEIIAIAILQLAFQFHSIEMNDIKWTNKSPDTYWWDNFVNGLTKKKIDDVCHFALDYYEKLTKGVNGQATDGMEI